MKSQPKYGGARDLSYVKRAHEDDLDVTIYSDKYTFSTEDEFKYLVSYFLDAVREHKGITCTDMARRTGKSASSFQVMKYDGVSTFRVFFQYCTALNINPIRTLQKCLDLFSQFQSSLLRSE